MKRLFVIGHNWPEPGSSAAGIRMLQLLALFKREHYRIFFASTASDSPHSFFPKDLEVEKIRIKLNDPGFDELVQKLRPDIVMFDRFMTEEQFGWRVDRFSPNSLKILDTEDLHFLRDARLQGYKKKRDPEVFYRDSELAKREIAAIYRCDLSLIISEVEMDLLSRTFGIPSDLLWYLPFLLEDPLAQQEQLISFHQRKDLVSIGNFLHEPNKQAVLFLKEAIWPRIRQKLPGARLHIYGAYPTRHIMGLHDPKTGFLVHGRIEDARGMMQGARLCLAPLAFGAGLKGKFILAMECGTPSVTTAVGAEGLSGEHPWPGYIADDPEAFSEAVIALYQDQEAWETAQKQGFSLLYARFRSEAFSQEFRRRLQELIMGLKEHRLNNFTGSMLKHHLHRSTYFMSRFIQEKNKQRGGE